MFSFKTFSIAHSTCLSLRGPLLGFTSSPQGRLSSPCITPLSHQPRPAERNIPPPIPFFFFFRVTISFPCFCARRSNPSSGAYPNITMSRAAICVLTGSAGGALLDRGQNNSFTWSSSHAHVISLLYFGNATERSHSSPPDPAQILSFLFKHSELACISQLHLNISHMNNLTKSYYNCCQLSGIMTVITAIMVIYFLESP